MRMRAYVPAIWLALAAGGAAAAPFCAVTGLEGEAALVAAGGARVALTTRPLAPTDGAIETGAAARVRVTCDDGTIVTVGPDSRVDLGDLLASAADDPSLVVRLLEGIAGFVRPETAVARFEVETPAAVAAVRSTEWLVEHDDGASAVFVRLGQVAVSNATDTFLLETGEGITLTRTEVVRPVARWGQPRIDQSTGALGFAWD